MQEALKAIVRNKGSPGIDGITTKEIEMIMWQKWPKIRQEILEGKYFPPPVRRVEIPKTDGNGVRQLGIPTVMDRIKIRGLTKKMRGSKITVSIRKYLMPIMRGWANYLGIAEEKGLFESLDGWIRRKLQGILWRQWKKPGTRCKCLIALGVKGKTARDAAYSRKGPWRMAKRYAMHKAVSNEVLGVRGYTSMANMVPAGS